MKRLSLLTVSILIVLLAGCATIDQARTNYCESLGNFAQAVVSMRAIDENSTIEDVEDARRAVAAAWDDLVRSVGNLRDEQFNELESAFDEFDNTIEDIPDDASLAEAQAIVHQAALDLTASYVDIATTTCEYPPAQQMVTQQQQ